MKWRQITALAIAGAAWALGCQTVDLGDNFPPPELQLDEDFFVCQIQPNVVTFHRCASGGAGEGGQCHSARSALRLSTAAETETPPPCEDTDGDGIADTPTAPAPAGYRDNFQAVQFTVQSDPDSSPFYRRSIGRDSHPRAIFPDTSMEADLIRLWITSGGS